MEPTRSPVRRPHFTISQVMAVVAAVAFALGLAIYYPPIFYLFLFGGMNVGTYLVIRGGPKHREKGRIMFGLSKKERWAKILETPFPPEWVAILEKNVPIYGRLPEGDRGEL